MKTHFPPKLKTGDMVRVISPSSSGATIKRPILTSAKKALKNVLGLNSSYSKNVFEKDMIGSSSVSSRVKDLHDAFSDPSISAIFCVRGGFSANTLLKQMDWELIKNNLKPICGFSDITILANAIFAKTGIVTYLGPNFSSFGVPESVPYTAEYFRKCLMDSAPFEVVPSKKFGERDVPFRKNPGTLALQEGSATGTIIGGHLSTLNLLHGTEYMPSLKNTILFIESDNFGGKDSVVEFERDLQSLLHQKGAEYINGIVFGRFQKNSEMTTKKLQHVIFSKPELQNIPIIINADFGHTRPLITLPIGGTARITANKNNCTIEILKH